MLACWILLAALGELPQVDVSTLSGEVHSGSLKSLSSQQLEVSQDGKSVSVPTSELLQVYLQSAAATNAAAAPGAAEARFVLDLWDGSMLIVTELSSQNGAFQARHPLLGLIAIERARLRSVRLAGTDPVVEAAWKDLQSRSKKRDYLVIRKGDVLDHLDGVVGELTTDKLKFVLDGDPVDVNRTRVFGWVYAPGAEASQTAKGVRVDLPGQQHLYVASVDWQTDHWTLRVSANSEPAQVPADAIRSLDFSAGKVLYLSAVEPRSVEHVPFFGPGGEWPYQRDRDLFGRPLRVGNRTFPRGLALHSRTLLTYRLGGDYRRLTAVAGLDPVLMPSNEPAINNVKLVMRGDGKVLFEADIRAGDAPIPLELPVVDVRELEILVDFGEKNMDIGDRLHLGDLKALK